MPRVSLDFEVLGEKQLSRFFDLSSSLLSDMTGIFLRWGEDFRETQHGVFASEGAFEGRSRWEELSPRYREWKEANYPGQPILVLTGRMRSGLTDKEDSDHIEEIDSTNFAIGVRSDYAQFHQTGTGRMPQRKVIELTEPQKLRWVQIARQETWAGLEQAAVDMGITRDFRERMARDT